MKKIKRKVWIQNCGVRKLTKLEKGLLIDMAVDGWWQQMKATIEVEGHRLKIWTIKQINIHYCVR